MPANTSLGETDLVDAAVAWLTDQLPPSWAAERRVRQNPAAGPGEPETIPDALINVRAPNGMYTTFAVEAKRTFSPRDVERLLPGLTQSLRTLTSNPPILVIAPWMSPRSQELLDNEDINFIDLTGNALIRLENPAVFIKTAGATRNPDPEPRGRAGVRGPKAARLVRLLADTRPPYGVREIAGAAQLAPGYVSRLLDALDREALIERSRKGEVESVDVPPLLRRWAESYDVLKTNKARSFIAPGGAAKALQALEQVPTAAPLAITGSFAAVRFAPVAAPALLLAYCEDVAPVVDALDLLPADEGANVVLMRPFDRVVWDRTVTENGLTYVAPSQAAVDCLTGTGRMPAEGEALLDWMTENEARWRLNSLSELADAGAPV